MSPLRSAPSAVVALGLAAGLLQCSAEGLPAPEPVAPAQACGSLEELMPEFFAMLRDPAEPLAGLRAVVVALADDDTASLRGNAVGQVLQKVVRGLAEFTRDPGEEEPARPTSCFPAPPSDRALCVVEAAAGEPCESRLCATRRALDFGIRDLAAKDALAALRPVVVKVLRYIDGSDDDPHLDGIRVLNAAARAEGLCSPANALGLLDGILLYFRTNPECAAADSCVAYRALGTLHDLLTDPALDEFLTTFESGQDGGRGRAGFQQLGRVLLNAVANTPEDETYFDQVQNVVDTVLGFLNDEKWDGLRPKVETTVALLKGLLDPFRPNAILPQIKAVSACLANPDVDPEMALVGAMYDLVSRPRDQPGGVDLVELVDALEGVARSDPHGILAGALHASFATTLHDEAALEAVRVLLVEALTEENTRLAMPALIRMVERGVFDELVAFLDTIVYGCRLEPDP